MGNVAIVGFMGTGKSVVALALTEKLHKSYVSTDDLIVMKEDKSIHDIFKEKGEPYFRKVESEMVKKASEMENVVIDCGGGVVLKEENVKNLKKKGPVVSLSASPSVIYERVKGHRHRPLLNVDDPKEAISRLLKEREAFYAQADFNVDTSELSVHEVVAKICTFLEGKDRGRA
ncbi:MAG: AAA family ATPase [Candidatus Omnitrophica bacterium]|nr:AAA family ATPase [Candidatus Omnitrophota bacterium]